MWGFSQARAVKIPAHLPGWRRGSSRRAGAARPGLAAPRPARPAERDSSRSAMARSSFWRRVGLIVGLPCLRTDTCTLFSTAPAEHALAAVGITACAELQV